MEPVSHSTSIWLVAAILTIVGYNKCEVKVDRFVIVYQFYSNVFIMCVLVGRGQVVRV